MSNDPNYNPFQSPVAPQSHQYPPPAPMWNIMPFVSGHQRAVIAIVLLAIMGILNLAGAVSAAAEYASLKPLPNGDFDHVGMGAEMAQARLILSWLVFPVWIGTIVAFCMWTHRAARNLPALGGRGLKYTPGWAVGWFFVPIANLVMPYLVAAEIWRESDPAQCDRDGRGGKTTSPLVGAWWITYVVHRVAPGIVSVYATIKLMTTFIGMPSTTPEEMAARATRILPIVLPTTAAAQVLGLVAAILAIMYVWRVDANQQAKFDLISGERHST